MTNNYIPFTDEELRVIEFVMCQIGGLGEVHDLAEGIVGKVQNFLPDTRDRKYGELCMGNKLTTLQASPDPFGKDPTKGGALMVHERVVVA